MKPFGNPLRWLWLWALSLAPCATPVGAQLSDERALSDVQRIYKNAALVVMGECVQSTSTAKAIPATTFPWKKLWRVMRKRGILSIARRVR